MTKTASPMDLATYALSGASAKSIAVHCAGVGDQTGDYPRDSGDFARCEAMLEVFPEYRRALPKMAEVNAYWAELVPHWEHIRHIGDADAQTTKIRQIIIPVQRLDPSHIAVAPGASMRVGPISFSHDAYKAAKAQKTGKPPMKHDPDFASAAQNTYDVTADELRQFIERFEHLAAEKQDIADQQKEVMAEAKARGYDTKALRKIIALRKRKPDEVAEEQAVLDLYMVALGMT